MIGWVGLADMDYICFIYALSPFLGWFIVINWISFKYGASKREIDKIGDDKSFVHEHTYAYPGDKRLSFLKKVIIKWWKWLRNLGDWLY